ncbi:hypothetical protein ACFX2I_001835 [Malus domestica]
MMLTGFIPVGIAIGVGISDVYDVKDQLPSSSMAFLTQHQPRQASSSTRPSLAADFMNLKNSEQWKERKEKLGERIVALQQLVSPFGKTDTASVLLEAMEYIRFLHEQVKVLSAPYLQGTPTANTQVSLSWM